MLPDLVHLAGLTADGILNPLVDEVYPFDRVRDAHARVDSGRKCGTVVLVVS